MQRFAILSPTGKLNFLVIFTDTLGPYFLSWFHCMLGCLGSWPTTIRDNLFSRIFVDRNCEWLHSQLSFSSLPTCLLACMAVEPFAIYVSSINMATTGQRESLKETHHEPRDKAEVNNIFIVLSNLSPAVVWCLVSSEGQIEDEGGKGRIGSLWSIWQ